MRVFWLFNHPAPYKVEFFSLLGKSMDLTVFFERDKEGGRNDAFYDEPSSSYTRIIGKPLKLGPVNNYTRKPISYLKARDNYDLVIINGWRTLTERIVIRYCKSHHIPYVFYINGGIVPSKESKLKRAYKTSFIRGASFYMAPDPRSKKYLIHYGADPKKIILYPYGSIKENEILRRHIDKKALRKKLQIQGEHVYVSTGFFIERKNFESLISFWTNMDASSHLYLIGEGPKRKDYFYQMKSLGLENVHILPYRKHEELFAFYQACDAFLFPSKEDIYGHVIAEALSQGLPVFSSPNVNAAQLLLKKGYNGGIVDIADPSLAKLLQETDFELLSSNAVTSASPYTYEQSAKAHIEIFKTILKEIKR